MRVQSGAFIRDGCGEIHSVLAVLVIVPAVEYIILARWRYRHLYHIAVA